MIREFTMKMYYDVDDGLIEKGLPSTKESEQIVHDQLENIYGDEIGFDVLRVQCQDYKDEYTCKLMREFLNGLKEPKETKQVWRKMAGVFTSGGDPAYECPVCGNGRHVYGIESLEPHKRCRDCGTELVYPWEVEQKSLT